MNTASKKLVTLVGDNTPLYVQEYGIYDVEVTTIHV